MKTPALNGPAITPDDAAMDHQVRVFLEGRSLIQAHIRSLVRDAALAEDVFQEVWVRFERVTRPGSGGGRPKLVARFFSFFRYIPPFLAEESVSPNFSPQPVVCAEKGGLQSDFPCSLVNILVNRNSHQKSQVHQ